MNYWILFASVLVGCLICMPMFTKMYKAIIENKPEFEKGYKSEFNRDSNEDFINDKLGGYFVRGSEDAFVNRYEIVKFVALAIPVIPSCLLAVPIYFLLLWVYQHAI